MLVSSRINNNVVQVEKDRQQLIVMGKGIGFNVHVGEAVNERLIEHIFVLQDAISLEYFASVITNVSMEDITLVKEIISIGEQELALEFNPNLLLTLLDHLSFAFKRLKDNITIQNPLQWEIRQLYPKELRVGQKAVALITEKKGVTLPQEEEVFIANHFINAQLEQHGMAVLDELTTAIDDISQIITYHFHKKIDKESVNFTRFATHLRYYIMRQINHEIADIGDGELLALVKNKYVNEFACAEKIAAYVETHYGGTSSEGEKLYLTLHIQRVMERVR